MADHQPASIPLQRLVNLHGALNRKEVFYTATVLPAILCKNNFEYFGKFLDLIGLDGVKVSVDPEQCNIIYYSEYNLIQSLQPLKEWRGWSGQPSTPDVVIFIRGPEHHLISIEAKMFDTPGPEEILRQVQQQQQMLCENRELFCRNGDPSPLKMHSILLLPAKLSEGRNFGDSKVVTWEDILACYQGPAQGDYFYNLLKIALDKYDDLASPNKGGQNADAKITGQVIYDGVLAEGAGYQYKYVGRGYGGRNGEPFQNDIKTGNWRRQPYEVRRNPLEPGAPAQKNWFPVSEFIQAITDAATSSPATSRPPS